VLCVHRPRRSLLNSHAPSSSARPLVLWVCNEDATVLLVWTTVYAETKFEGYRVDYCGLGRPMCVLTHHRERQADAAAVLFFAWDTEASDMPGISSKKRRRQRDEYQEEIVKPQQHHQQQYQPWVLWSAEPPYRLSRAVVSEHIAQGHFDRSMTYRFDSDYPVPFFNGKTVEGALAPMDPPVSRRNNDVPVAWFASNCESYNGRERIVLELQRYGVKVDSYGACFANQPNVARGDIFSTVPTIRQYKFYLSLENSNCRDYVTEKLHNALVAGAVPIVVGPKQDEYRRHFLPGPNAAVFVDDFYTAKDLAEYILFLHHNDTAYMAHHAHRDNAQDRASQATRDAFADTWDEPGGQNDRRGLCMLCEEAATWRRGERVSQHETTGYPRIRPVERVERVMAIDGQCEARDKYNRGASFL